MEDPYKEVFEEIGNAFRKHSEIILELAQMCLTVKQYQEFTKKFEGKVHKEEKIQT